MLANLHYVKELGLRSQKALEAGDARALHPFRRQLIAVQRQAVVQTDQHSRRDQGAEQRKRGQPAARAWSELLVPRLGLGAPGRRDGPRARLQRCRRIREVT